MHAPKSPTMHRFFRPLARIAGSAALAAALGGLSGCIIIDGGHDNGHPVVSDPPPELPEPMLVSVDTDQTMDAVPGEGVGLFVEYAAGGNWLLWTTCDTNYSNVACAFDVFATVDTSSTIDDVTETDLEGHDLVEVFKSGEVHLHAETSSDMDAVRILTTPGAILRVEMSLDGVAEQRFIYWVSGGVLHEGAPTNPVDFEPTSP